TGGIAAIYAPRRRSSKSISMTPRREPSSTSPLSPTSPASPPDQMKRFITPTSPSHNHNHTHNHNVLSCSDFPGTAARRKRTRTKSKSKSKRKARAPAASAPVPVPGLKRARSVPDLHAPEEREEGMLDAQTEASGARAVFGGAGAGGEGHVEGCGEEDGC
ncbi:hypothetical protein DXG01_001211, partial [Tephrocybe rancida]